MEEKKTQQYYVFGLNGRENVNAGVKNPTLSSDNKNSLLTAIKLIVKIKRSIKNQ